jgi:hypothetical protein
MVVGQSNGVVRMDWMRLIDLVVAQEDDADSRPLPPVLGALRDCARPRPPSSGGLRDCVTPEHPSTGGLGKCATPRHPGAR